MKATTILILFMFVAFFSTGQILNKTNILKDVDVKPPVFTGIHGTVEVLNEVVTASIYDYLRVKLEYPKEAEKIWREGTTVIQFTVLPNGELDDFDVLASISSDIDSEVIRVLQSSDGMWKPGQNNGTPVAMEKEVAITFKMEYSNHLRMAQKLYQRGNKKLLKDKHKRALRLFDRAYVYQPFSETILFTRGLTRFNVGNETGACEDWNRLKSLGSDLADAYLMKYCEMNEIAVNN
ncbi:energy transducer TonB [Ancylomarina sp. YFZ004]